MYEEKQLYLLPVDAVDDVEEDDNVDEDDDVDEDNSETSTITPLSMVVGIGL